MTPEEARKIIKAWFARISETLESLAPKAWRLLTRDASGVAYPEAKVKKAAIDLAVLIMQSEKGAIGDALEECRTIRQDFTIANVPATVPAASRQYYRDGYKDGAAALVAAVLIRKTERSDRLAELRTAQQVIDALPAEAKTSK